MKWAREYVRTHYRPMAPRPDVVFTYCADIPEVPRPVDLGAFFEALTASFVPNPNRSEGQARQWEHSDLAGLSDSVLARERDRAAFLLTWGAETDERLLWIAERARAVGAELQRRARLGQTQLP